MNHGINSTNEIDDRICHYDELGHFHRVNGPAVYNYNGYEAWYNHGKLHRLGGPAVYNSMNGYLGYFVDGLPHRTTGPAVLSCDGSVRWYKRGKLHREDGPAVLSSDGTKMWYNNDLLHRIDGPALDYFGKCQEWYCRGKLHRIDGPALIYNNNYEEWWIAGKRFPKKELYLQALERRNKIASKYFRRWLFLCDQPGKKLFEMLALRSYNELPKIDL